METATLNNDTRGWIMCIVSGIGLSTLLLQSEMPRLTKPHSLRSRCLDNMRRSHRPALPRKAEISHRGEQRLPRELPQSELWCHGANAFAVCGLPSPRALLTLNCRSSSLRCIVCFLSQMNT